MRLRSARRTNRADIVDWDVEQRSRNDARYHQRRAARHILMPRVPHRFHCLSSPGKCPLPPANARLEFCNHALLPADWTTGFYPHQEAAINYWFESRQNWVALLAVEISLRKRRFLSSMTASCGC